MPDTVPGLIPKVTEAGGAPLRGSLAWDQVGGVARLAQLGHPKKENSLASFTERGTLFY